MAIHAKSLPTLLGVVTALGICSTANAKVEPQPYVTGSGLAVVPTLGLGYRYDDNLGLTDTDTESSGIFVFEPGIALMAERGLNQYSAYYNLKVGEYFDSSIDDYVDHLAGLNAKLDLATRHRLTFDYKFAHQHEGRGSGISEGLGGLLEELLYYRTNDLAAVYSFGAQGAQGRFDLSLGWGDKEYTELEETTQFRNWDELRYGAKLFYRVSSATEAFFEIKRLEREYDVTADGEATRDNDDTFYYVGALWDITGKTSGEAKLGYETKKYDASSREDFDGFSWEVALTYLPVDYSQFTFTTSNAAKDPDQLGDYIEEALYRLEWEHYWLERFSSRAAYAYTDESYTGIDRDDETDRFELSFAYDFRRWLEFRAGWEWQEKSSSVSGIGYDQNVYYFTLTGTL
ncbi:outer membrane beta-barrel protein [Aliagarivorans taiwanensis]|uniref:outer membrane beta-barrel protein n=1 Tax=Aliagarivorans taiwanensis TaxID=561966 RepID=UPI000688C2F8|nr:outer membrane beta-barrel protein [Aliagarivorans taiwanensis]